MDATCTSNGSRPTADIVWKFRNSWINDNPSTSIENVTTETFTVISTLHRQLSKSDNGQSLQCRSSNEALPTGLFSQTVKLEVFCKYIKSSNQMYQRSNSNDLYHWKNKLDSAVVNFVEIVLTFLSVIFRWVSEMLLNGI